MDMLPSFRVLAYLGIWIEEGSSFVFLRRLCGLFLSNTIFYFTLTEVIELYLLRNNIEELVDVMFLTVTFAMLCLKILNFNFRHKGLLNLLTDFRMDVCKARSPEEENILNKYTTKILNIFQNILVLSQATGIFFCVLPFITLEPADYEIPYKTYQFYDDTTAMGFTITCVIQFIALIFGIFINVSMDTMIYGFIILSTGQFELISYRINKSSKENDRALLKQCIMHHNCMNNLVKKTTNLFMTVIAPLFFFSLLTLCASIFQMSQNDIISLEFLGFAMYLSCMLCQVFLYCWYGNELKLKSADLVNEVFGSDWTVLEYTEKKTLYLLMLSAQRPCDISWRGQCTLSLETFVWIMKTSYTAFNLLQRASDK
ncbi:odorant receptor 125 [Nasonia vitripennis]|uniref:Odorant receptor n=1 Tax=Nasonia vitripennis TaxID=7425 RepID=A0A7M6W8I5_NASVI|nr:odorant receptor 125 [Nasonia vitripennis]